MDRHPFYAEVVPRIEDLMSRAAPPDRRSDGLLVALSGGPDSVALLLAAHCWAERSNATVEAAHLNHQLRGDAALADEDFCRALCERLDIRLQVRRADPRPLARRRGLGLEEAGRHLRHTFLHELLRDRPRLSCVATGHHRDDQTETVIMRLFRGTGLDGLRGIAPVSGRFIHPLLAKSRREIIAFLEAEGQPYRLDASNETGDATRTRVRRELLPVARDIFGSGADHVPARLADLVAPEVDLLENLASGALADMLGEENSEAMPSGLPVAALQALIPALQRRILRLCLERLGGKTDIGLVHVDAILNWLPGSRSGGSLDLPGGWRVAREFDRLLLVPPVPTESPLSSPGTYRILVQSESTAESDTVVSADVAAVSEPDASLPGSVPGSRCLICPADAVQGRLRVRPWRPGDRIRLLGMDGHKKVSDLLQERRVGISERAGVQVVVDEAGILWVVGLARAERTRLLPATAQTITIAIMPSADGTEDADD